MAVGKVKRDKVNLKKGFSQLVLVTYLLLNFPLPHFSIADDTLVGGSGYTVFPITTDKIRMVSEYVTIKMGSYEMGKYKILARRAFVNCEFLFENTLSNKIDAEMGFPGNVYLGVRVSEPDLNDFISYIDGLKKEVRVKKEVVNQHKDKYSIDGGKTWAERVIEDYRFWYTWNVTFPPLKRIMVKNSYWVTLSSNQETWWFEYILATGSNWKGNIQKAVIEVIYPTAKDLKDRVIEIEPTGYKVSKNRIYWEFKNFKPTQNIKISEKDLGK